MCVCYRAALFIMYTRTRASAQITGLLAAVLYTIPSVFSVYMRGDGRIGMKNSTFCSARA